MAELQQAVFEDRCVQVLYEHYDGTLAERVLEPYSLVAKASLWYLIARREGELRIYRISRFHAVTLLDTHFQRTDDFDLPTYWQSHTREFIESLSEYTFTMRIHESRMNFIQWLTPGRCQILAPADADGWLTAQIRMESAGLARMIVFGLGKQGQVIEPPELREAVLQTARDLLE
jgi:predicted DNA-binding transcriptional regulator YafY